MKPILHGLEKFEGSGKIEKVPCEKVNVEALIETFESNRDKAKSLDWIQRYEKIAKIYTSLYTTGRIPADVSPSDEVFEMAQEHLDRDIMRIMAQPSHSSGMDYHYEFGRSLGVEQQAAQLKEHLDEDCDFI